MQWAVWAGIFIGTIAAWTFRPDLPLRAVHPESWVFKPPTFRTPTPPPQHIRATAYCGCKKCCGKWSTPEAITASGKAAVEGLSIAADWKVFPKGECLLLQGLGKRVVHDTGSAIKGPKLDIYFRSHQEAKEFGFKLLKVEPC